MKPPELAKIIEEIPVLTDRNYWFFRTNGGRYYDDFVKNGFIAIGYDQVPAKEILGAKTGSATDRKNLEKVVQRFYPKEKRPKYISTQLWDFHFSLKQGDIIIIPTTSSDKVAIGEILENKVFTERVSASENPRLCPYEKRKKVKWLQPHLRFSSLDPQLLHFKFTRRTITTIDRYSSAFIDRELQSIFIKDGEGHLIFEIKTHDNIPAFSLFQFWVDIINLSKEFCDDQGIEFEKDNIDVRINVQSPGTIEFVTMAIGGLAIITGIMCVVIGAEYEFEAAKTKLKFKTKGLIESVSDFRDRKAKRALIKTLNEKAKQMNFNEEEIVKLIEQINGKSEKT